MASVAPAPRQEVRGGGARNLLEKAACFVSSAEKDGAAAAARVENGETDALRRGVEDGEDGSSSYRSGSYVTRGGGTTGNFLSTAVLQHEQVDDDGGCGVVVECIAMAWPGRPCAALPVPRPARRGGGDRFMRRRDHKIVEMMTQRHRSEEYGGADGDPGSSGGSANQRRGA